jgi:hypothetical protein
VVANTPNAHSTWPTTLGAIVPTGRSQLCPLAGRSCDALLLRPKRLERIGPHLRHCRAECWPMRCALPPGGQGHVSGDRKLLDSCDYFTSCRVGMTTRSATWLWLPFGRHSWNKVTWCWSSVGLQRERRVVPMTAGTVHDSKSVWGSFSLGLERWDSRRVARVDAKTGGDLGRRTFARTCLLPGFAFAIPEQAGLCVTTAQCRDGGGHGSTV